MKRPRAVILGFDSATFDVIRPLAAQGRLPHLARILQEGVWGQMTSTMPPRTAPAWVSLMTGQNPGNHGVFDFFTRKVDGYEVSEGDLVTSANYAGRTLFDVLSARGKSVAALFVPMTFPTWQVNGQMVAGPPLTPGSDEGLSFPPGIHRQMGIEDSRHLFPPSIKRGVRRKETIEGLFEMDRSRAQAASELWESGRHDCLMAVMEAIDIIQHFLWQDFQQSCQSEFGRIIPAIYEAADQIVGRFASRLEPDDLLFVVSDHGMAAHPHICFHINAWLASEGWLTYSGGRAVGNQLVQGGRRILRSLIPESLYLKLAEEIKGSDSDLARRIRRGEDGVSAIDWPRTRAYRFKMPDLPCDGIMLNRAGRQPQGIVTDNSFDDEAERIRQGLLELKDPFEGQPVVRAVHRRGDLFEGPAAELMPDLVVEFSDSCKAGGKLHGDVFELTPAVERTRLSGTHSPRGIFLALGKPFAPGTRLDPMHICDFAPTVLCAMQHAVPHWMDGRINLQCFRQGFLNRHPPQIDRSQQRPQVEERSYTEEEKAEIEERLRSLGYL